MGNGNAKNATQNNGIKRTVDPYFSITRKAAQDETLSCEGLAALAYLLSKPDGWIVRNKDVQRRFGWGRDKTIKALKELRDKYYIVTEMIRGEDNRFTGKQDYVYSSPQTPAPLEIRSTENPDSGKSDTYIKESSKEKRDIDCDTSQKADSQNGVHLDEKITSQCIASVYNSTSSDGITPDDIALLQPYTISQIEAALKQAALAGRIEYDGIGRKAYRIGEKPSNVVEFNDLGKSRPTGEYVAPHSLKAGAIKDALIDAFGMSEYTLNKTEQGRYARVANELATSGVYADMVHDLHFWCSKKFTAFSVNALATNASAYLKERNDKASGVLPSAPLTQVERMKMELGL